MSKTVAATIAALSVLIPTAVFAQPAPGEGAPPPAGPMEAGPPPGAMPAPAGGTRFRWGVSGMGGYFLPSGTLTFGVAARLGGQLSDSFGVFGDFGGFFGLGGAASSSGVALSAVAFWNVGAMAELTLGEMLSLAGGPFLASGGWGYADSNGNAIGAGGYMPGLDLRVSLGFGSRKPSGRLGGFSLGLDVKFILGSVNSVSGTTVRIGDPALGIAPMLMIGYDSR